MDLLAKACTASLLSDLRSEMNEDEKNPEPSSEKLTLGTSVEDYQELLNRPLSGEDRSSLRYAARGSWTAEEDERLRRAVTEFGGRNWKKIAEQIPERTDVQCLHRWQKVLRPGLVKGPWTPEEDLLVTELVAKYGVKSWSFIARQLKGRLGKQCRERWYNHLNPDISKKPWTPEEDQVIVEEHRSRGNKWAEIAKKLPGRTDNSVKNRWNSTLARLFREQGEIAEGEASAFKAISKLSFRKRKSEEEEEEEVSSDSTVSPNNNKKKKRRSISSSSTAARIMTSLRDDPESSSFVSPSRSSGGQISQLLALFSAPAASGSRPPFLQAKLAAGPCPRIWEEEDGKLYITTELQLFSSPPPPPQQQQQLEPLRSSPIAVSPLHEEHPEEEEDCEALDLGLLRSRSAEVDHKEAEALLSLKVVA